MYSLDVNFLKDRPEFTKQEIPPKVKSPISAKIPLFAGIVVGAIFPLAVGGFWWMQQSEQGRLEGELNNVKLLLDKATQAQGELQKITQETGQYKQQAQALGSVFDQIKPWSALIKDVSERVPPGLQITCIAQVPVSPNSSGIGCQNVPNPPVTTTSQPTPAATPNPTPVVTTDKVEITGIARSFNGVNDLLLTLQKSPFFKDLDTKLITAQLIDNPIKLERNPGQQSSSVGGNFQIPELPKVVQFKIQTNLTEKTASQLLPQLYGLGDLGLTSRIETLKQQGVIK